jgi:DNA-binding CsgD family transcriptional regulator
VIDDMHRERETANRNRRLSAPLKDLRRTKTVDGLEAVVDRARAAFCFAHVTFLVARAGIEQTATPLYLTTYPPEWVELYLERNYFDLDPVLAEARFAFLPFDWSRIVDRQAGIRAFFDEARSFGIGRHGLTVPIRASNGERSLLSVTSNQSAREWKQQRLACEDDLFVFARHLHDRFITLCGLRALNAPGSLSRRERQCLELLGQGLLPKQIAARLGVSESAIRKYAYSAKQKLRSRTLSQAMARAAALDIILP